jgi:hypothetical protein
MNHSSGGEVRRDCCVCPRCLGSARANDTCVVYEQRVNNLTDSDFHMYYVSAGRQNVLVYNTGCKVLKSRHAEERMRQRGFDDLDIQMIRTPPNVYKQGTDGAMIYVSQSGRDTYNVLVVNGDVVVTAMKDKSMRELSGLAKRYEWSGFP